MEMIVCTIYDSGSESFGRPWYARATGEAMRVFTNEVNRPGTPEEPNPLNQHPQDFRLYSLGKFDDQAGRFSLADPPILLCSAEQVKV